MLTVQVCEFLCLVLDEKFRDDVIPIADRQFNLFKFPLIEEDIDPLIILKKYSRVTRVGFMTETKLIEVSLSL